MEVIRSAYGASVRSHPSEPPNLLHSQDVSLENMLLFVGPGNTFTVKPTPATQSIFTFLKAALDFLDLRVSLFCRWFSSPLTIRP